MSTSSVQPILVLFSASASANPTQYVVEQAFGQHDLDWRYLTLEVAPERLGDAIAGMKAMGFRGAHCDGAFKQAVMPLLDRATDVAAAVGAANMLLLEDGQLMGDNVEGKGVVESLRRTIDPAGKRVVLLGAGHVARAVAFELAAAGVAELRIVNRTEAHAQQLAGLLAERFPLQVAAQVWEGDFAVPAETEIVLHATALGHQRPNEPVPLAPDSLRAGLVVADVTVDPPQTWLLRTAAEHGCTTLDGLTMFVEQAAIALVAWTGVDPDRDVMHDAAEEFLEL